MAKKNNLAAALAANEEQAAPPAPAPKSAPETPPRAPSRSDQVNIASWFDQSVKLTLDELRIARRKTLGRRITQQEMIAEALNDLFKKYGFPEVAPVRED